jgi:glyoxylase-like metal-dependent hydrolase (beta-lactamase superfamily II)
MKVLKLERFNEYCYAFTGAVNIGYCQKDGRGLLIDAGLDKTAIKKVLKILKQKELPLDYCIITHAHTDHYGGAAYVKKETGIPLYSPPMESAIIENPLLEPIYLFNGANPVNELRNKFLEGPPVKVDFHIESGRNEIGPFVFQALDLPGHSYAQKGLLIEDTLYASDAYFGIEALEKHVVPFIIDADQTLASLEKLLNIKCKGAIPGHGRYEEDFSETIRQNQKVHEERIHVLFQLIESKEDGESLENLTRVFLDLHMIDAKNLGQWLLFRTSVTAYLTHLERKGAVRFYVRENEPRVAVPD